MKAQTFRSNEKGTTLLLTRYIMEIRWRMSYGVPVLTGICKIEIVNSAENKEKFRFRIAKLFSKAIRRISKCFNERSELHVL